MARVVITIDDAGDDGEVRIEAVFAGDANLAFLRNAGKNCAEGLAIRLVPICSRAGYAAATCRFSGNTIAWEMEPAPSEDPRNEAN